VEELFGLISFKAYGSGRVKRWKGERVKRWKGEKVKRGKGEKVKKGKGKEMKGCWLFLCLCFSSHSLLAFSPFISSG
jgi:hypothetical protein